MPFFVCGKGLRSTEQGDQRFWKPVTSGSSIRQVLNLRDTLLGEKSPLHFSVDLNRKAPPWSQRHSPFHLFIHSQLNYLQWAGLLTLLTCVCCFASVTVSLFTRIVQHLGKYASLVPFQELDEKIETSPVWDWSYSELTVSIKTGNLVWPLGTSKPINKLNLTLWIPPKPWVLGLCVRLFLGELESLKIKHVK